MVEAQFILNMPEADYHDHPAINSTCLKTLHKTCPAVAKFQREAAHNREPTPALTVGSAVHALVLEGEAVFRDKFAVTPKEIDRRTKAGKEAYADFLSANSQKGILNNEQYSQAHEIASSVLNHSLAAELLSEGEPEVSGFAVDPETGLPTRARYDCLREHMRIVVDLKTGKEAEPLGFSRAVEKYGYHIQAAHYSEVFRHITGEDVAAFIFIAVEKTPPYAVGVYTLPDSLIQRGRREWRAALNLWAKCQEEESWPSYGGGELMEVFDFKSK